MGLNHEDILNKLLAEACPQRSVDAEEKVYEFVLTAPCSKGDCVRVIVTAKYLKWDHAADKYHYEIIDARFEYEDDQP